MRTHAVAQYRPDKPTVLDIPISNNGGRVHLISALGLAGHHRSCSRWWGFGCCLFELGPGHIIKLIAGEMDHLQEGTGATV